MKKKEVSIWEILPKPYSDILMQVIQERTFDKKRIEDVLKTKFGRDFGKNLLNVDNILRFIYYLGGKVIKDGKTIGISLKNVKTYILKVDYPWILLISDLHSPATDFNSLEKILKKSSKKEYGRPLVLAAGDLTISGREDELRRVIEDIDNFIWGNHDACRGSKILNKYCEKCLGRMIGGIEVNNILLILFHDYLWYLNRKFKFVDVQAHYNDIIIAFGHTHYGFLYVGGKDKPFYVKKRNNERLILVPLGAMTIHGNYKRFTLDYTTFDAKRRILKKYILRKSHGRKDNGQYSISF